MLTPIPLRFGLRNGSLGSRLGRLLTGRGGLLGRLGRLGGLLGRLGGLLSRLGFTSGSGSGLCDGGSSRVTLGRLRRRFDDRWLGTIDLAGQDRF
jgi:hypothetical protein